MSYTRPSRLYRRLTSAGCPTPLFELTVGSAVVQSDDAIRSLSIRHGTSGPDEGLHPSTLEAPLAQLFPIMNGSTISVRLREPAARWIEARTGRLWLDYAQRFSGRLGVQNVRDSGDRQWSTLMGSAWSAQLHNTRNTHTFAPGRRVRSILVEAMRPPHLVDDINVTSDVWDDYIVNELPNVTFSDIFSKYATDIGIAALQNRSGIVRLANRQNRIEAGLEAATAFLPITRAQTLAPAEWAQANEIVQENLSARFVNAAGEITTYYVDIGSPATSPDKELDWTHVQFTTDQYLHVKTLEHREATKIYTIPKLSFDLVALLTSPREMDWKQAVQLLSLNPGDPVTLSGDWPPGVSGVHFATGIGESITPSGWRIDLDLTAYLHITGEPSPYVRPMVWDSARNPWDSETRNWNMENAS